MNRKTFPEFKPDETAELGGTKTIGSPNNSPIPRNAIPTMRTSSLLLFICSIFTQAGFSAPLFIQTGSDPSFQEILKSGALPRGQNSKTGITGSKIKVEHQLVELTPEAKRPMAKDILIHTLGNSAIPRSDFGKWSRWYQEDGPTQVFRLFPGETNMRNERALAARIEAFSELNWQHGPWHEWSATYTIIKPHGAAIFQVKNNVNDWAVQINMNDNGDVILNRRRGKDEVIATNMVAKPFFLRVRDNGNDYEVYLEGKKVGDGSFARPEGQTAFRWGMYLGAHEVKHDAVIFVSGATVDAGGGK